MKRIPPCLVLVLLNLTAFAGSPESFDWPQWQGPDRNAVSTETGLLQKWPEDGPPVAWRIEGLGGGYGAPAITGGRIFGMSNRGDEEVAWCLSEVDGKELWTTHLGPAQTEGMPQGKEGPGCTPTIDGDRLYVLGLGGALVCMKVLDGDILWRRSLTDDFGGRIPTWRYNESPLIDGNRLVCTPGGEEVTLVALDKSTGDTIWKSHVPDGADSGSGPAAEPPDRGRRGPGRGPRGFNRSGAAYASAIAVDFDGVRQYVQLTAKTLVGVAASDGKVLWRYDRPANRMGINCSTPLCHNDLIFAASAYGAGGGLVKLNKDANGTIGAEEVYFTSKMQNHHGGMILWDGCLYGANGGNGGGFLTCLDFQSGDVLWIERNVPKGSLAMADERLYYRTEKGTVILIEPNRERYVELGRFEQPDRSKSPAWTHPVIANGKLYVRDQDLLFCYALKPK